MTSRPDHVEWQAVCRLVELEIERGAAALQHGQAVAMFRPDEATVHALANRDPIDRGLENLQGNPLR